MPHISLLEYMAAHPPNSRQCWFCSLPPEVRAEAEDGYRQGVSQAAITRWLQAIGHDGATTHKVKAHMSAHLRD